MFLSMLLLFYFLAVSFSKVEFFDYFPNIRNFIVIIILKSFLTTCRKWKHKRSKFRF